MGGFIIGTNNSEYFQELINKNESYGKRYQHKPTPPNCYKKLH